MHAAVVSSWSTPPYYTVVDDIPLPPPDSDLVQVKVHYVGLHELVRSRASGMPYSIPGVDGTGTTPDGTWVYFVSFGTSGTSGTYCEYINLSKQEVVPIPRGINPVRVAACMNPMLSSRIALATCTTNLPLRGWTALVVGATPTSGMVAARVAKGFGAKRIIGVAKDVTTLVTAKLGFTSVLKLEDDAERTDFSSIGAVDVVLDYAFGAAAEALLSQITTEHGPVQYVQLDELGERMEMNLPGAVLRSKNIAIQGPGPVAWPTEAVVKELPKMISLCKSLWKIGVDVVPLSKVEEAWTKTGRKKVVFKVQ